MIADIKLYTDSILTIPSQYLTEEYIGKIAKATSVKLADMIRNKEITKTTGGKISSEVVTVAIDNKTGKVYYGLSNPLNNPTNNATTHKVLKELIDNAGTPPIAYKAPCNNCEHLYINTCKNIYNLVIHFINSNE